MNRRQAKKREKKQALEYLKYLDRYFDENEKWCILNECPYYDHSGIYGGSVFLTNTRQKGRKMRPIDADELLKGRTDHEMISTHLIFNAPTVDVLDKIKAEIENIEIEGYIRDVECFSAGINTALNIIDKYR